VDLWIGTSWKMNKTLDQARDWTRDVLAALAPGGTLADLPEHIHPFVIPSFTATALVHGLLGEDSRMALGVQNAHWEDAGAWTGEVSVPQAKDAGARIVEIGHSERREHFGETVETTALKVRAALRHGLTPLLCVGEPDAVKAAGESAAYIVEQAEGALAGLDEAELSRVLIAYEPIWAIGESGRPARMEELVEPFAALATRYPNQLRGLLYGGSVNLDNARDILSVPHVSGLFVGRTAWNSAGYIELLRLAAGAQEDSAASID
jgi:triosephosphate isomerase